jgi:hypothetical protein
MTIVDVAKKRLMTVWLWQGLFVVSVAAIPVTNYLTLQSAMGHIRFAALNSKNTWYITGSGTFEDTTREHLDMAKLACSTMFERSPDGLDSPERVDRVFNEKTSQQVKDDVAKDADTFAKQHLNQFVKFGLVREVQLEPNSAVVEVNAQLTRKGFLNGQDATIPLVVYVKLTPNDEIEQNRRYPMVVWAYEVKLQ